VIVPFLALAIAQAAGAILGEGRAVTPRRRTLGSVVVGAYVASVAIVTAYFWPVLVGQVIPYADWLRRMWFRSWI